MAGRLLLPVLQLLLLLLVHHTPLHVFLKPLDLLAKLVCRLAYQTIDDIIDLRVPWCSLGQDITVALRISAAAGTREPMETRGETVVQVDRRGIWLILLDDCLHQGLAADVRYLGVLLLELADLLPLHWVGRLHAWWLPREDVLY